MNPPTAPTEIAFSIDGEFVPMPQARLNRHGQLRIPSDHPVHDQRKRIRQAARAVGAVPVLDVAVEVECVICANAVSGKGSSVLGTIIDALEGVAFKEAWQVARSVVSRQQPNEGEAPYFTVVVKSSKILFDTF